MKGKKIPGLAGYSGKLVWVEFESPDSASCENCGACGTAALANQVYRDGVYRVDGHFLIAPEEPERYYHEFIPRIMGLYEYTE